MDEDRENINAVYAKDLDNLFNKLGIKQKFIRGELGCKFCNEIITYNNLHSLFKESGAVKLVCDKPDCVGQLMFYVEDKKRKISD